MMDEEGERGPMELAGKVALVTGAGRGLGRSCATMLARRGASVVIADIDTATAADSAQAITGEGGSAV